MQLRRFNSTRPLQGHEQKETRSKRADGGGAVPAMLELSIMDSLIEDSYEHIKPIKIQSQCTVTLRRTGFFRVWAYSRFSISIISA